MFQESVARVSQLESAINQSQVTRELNNYPRWQQYRHENFPTPSMAPPLELRLIARPRRLQPRPSRFFASVQDECAHLGGLRLSDLPGGRIVRIRRDEMQRLRYGRLEQRVRCYNDGSSSPRTTLTAMKMKGAKELVIWYDENVRVTLERDKKGESWRKVETRIPKEPRRSLFQGQRSDG